MYCRRVVMSIVAVLVVCGASALLPGRVASAGTTDLAGEFLDALEALGPRSDVATLRASDRGYGADQLLDAILAAELRPNGKIVSDGEVLTPQGEPAGILAGNGPGGGDVSVAEVNRALKRNAADLRSRSDVLGDLDRASSRTLLVSMIAAAALSGYSPEQIIVDGLLANPPGFRAERIGGTLVVAIRGADGDFLQPEGSGSPRNGGIASFLDDVVDDLQAATGGGTTTSSQSSTSANAEFCKKARAWLATESADVASMTELEELAPLNVELNVHTLVALAEVGGPQAAARPDLAQESWDRAVAALEDEVKSGCR